MIRTGDLAAITGTTRDSLRNRLRDDELPWRDERPEDGGQRRFDGSHALRLVITDTLARQGFTLPFAAEVVRANGHLIEAFLDEIARGEDPKERFIAAAKVCEQLEGMPPTWFPVLSKWSGEASEIVEYVRRALDNTGRVTDERGRINRRIAGPMIAVAPVRECYLLLKSQAADAGFRVEGRKIEKVRK